MDTTVSHGIVSSLHRSGLHVEGYQDFIQTDASLNPGSSSRAIVNRASTPYTSSRKRWRYVTYIVERKPFGF
jgi:hypothetical protein